MAEYIEREALREAFIKHFEAFYDDGKLVFSDHICTAEDCEDILKMVAELPTVDVVPVVRCKDCKWFGVDSTKGGFCMRNDSPAMWRNETGELKFEDYCSYGERRCEE